MTAWTGLVLLCAAAGAALEVPLLRHRSTRERLAEQGRFAALAAKCRHSVGGKYSRRVAARADYDPICETLDVVHTSTVSLGQPPQQFRVVFDPSSLDVWVPDARCVDAACADKTRFNYANSASYQFVTPYTPFFSQRGVNMVNGFVGMETFALTGSAGSAVTATQQTFGQATYLTDYFKEQPFDGVCGVGRTTDGRQSALVRAIEQSGDAVRFTVWQTNTDGGIVLGTLGTGGGHCTGATVNTQVVGSGAPYQVSMQGATFGNLPFVGTAIVAIDTSYPYLAGPSAVVEDAASFVGATYDPATGLYLLPSNPVVPTLTINLDGVKVLTVPSADLVVTINNKQYLGVQPFDGDLGGATWIMGGVLNRAYCITYKPADITLDFVAV